MKEHSLTIVALLFFSAELEITVNLLIQVDKLVQLIESPVFTCMIAHDLRFLGHIGEESLQRRKKFLTFHSTFAI